ncbi:L,D-transpeptidase [Actinocorallia lasiicapitis]
MIKRVLLGLLVLAGAAGCSGHAAEQPAPVQPVAVEQIDVAPPELRAIPAPIPTITVSARVRKTVPKSCWEITGACVKLSSEQAWLLRDGKIVRGPVPTTHGRPGYPTPTGRFKVEWQDEMDYSRTYGDAPMPWASYFAPGGIAFHEGSLSQASHGCIHLSRADAHAFFKFLQRGTPVQVVG